MRRTTKRNRSRSEGEALVAEFVESGRTQGDFCRERGIGVSTMQYWLKKMAAAEEAVNGSAGGGGFVELKVEAAEPAEINDRRGGREYELIMVNGTRLLVRGGFELGEVSALMTLLEARG